MSQSQVIEKKGGFARKAFNVFLSFALALSFTPISKATAYAEETQDPASPVVAPTQNQGAPASEEPDDTLVPLEDETSYVAQVGEVKYGTLAEAIAAAQAGDTVTLLADAALSGPIETHTAIILDLGGKKITSPAGALYVYADITIQNGTIESTRWSVYGNGDADITIAADATIKST